MVGQHEQGSILISPLTHVSFLLGFMDIFSFLFPSTQSDKLTICQLLSVHIVKMDL